jgi:alpha-glucosidase
MLADTTPQSCVEQYDSSVGQGLISRAGWVVWDDLGSPRLDGPLASTAKTWVDTKGTTNAADLYFFGHRQDYRAALQDAAQLSGRIAMPPLSALGVWWSRYYTYSQQQVVAEVLEGYHNHSLPLNHLVLDMDWCAQCLPRLLAARC